MAITQKWLVKFTNRGSMVITVGVEDGDEERGADLVDGLAWEALKSLQCDYPGVEDFNPGLVDVEEVQMLH